MSLLIPNRRKFLGGLGLLFAAPAIVQASNLMPVRSIASSDHSYLTLFDWANMNYPNMAEIADLLTKCNDLMTHMAWRTSGPIGKRVSIRQSEWRKLSLS